jgi:hypothetical protein
MNIYIDSSAYVKEYHDETGMNLMKRNIEPYWELFFLIFLI